ncbi:MAG: M20/M25/M40 family metallo-hydrolase [Halobacteriaceae archaeon]
MTADAFDPVAFLERAVRTPSHESVTAMREFVVETLADHGVDASVDGAGNVLATRGEGRPRHLLNTHLDTVRPHVPFSREGEAVRGRGACDAKGPLAAFLAAFLRADPEGSLALTLSPDEETLSTGAAHLAFADGDRRETLRGVGAVDGVVVGEPTGLDVCTAAKGRYQATVTLSGASAHAADPGDGVNAVAAAAPALAAISAFDEGADPHPDLGAPSLTPTTIAGGESTNQVPAECRIVVDRRPVPPESAGAFRTRLRRVVREAVPAAVGVDVSLTDREAPFLGPWSTPTADPLVERLAAASGGAVRPFTAATEASYFAQFAPTVVFGPGELVDEDGAVAHSDREYVRVGAVRAAADALARTLRA